MNKSFNYLCKILKQEIEKDKNIKVIGIAKNFYEAKDIVKNLNPDIIVMDVFEITPCVMEFLERLYQFYPKPVILICPVRGIPFYLISYIFKKGVIEIVDKDTLIYSENISVTTPPIIFEKIRRLSYNYTIKNVMQ